MTQVEALVPLLCTYCPSLREVGCLIQLNRAAYRFWMKEDASWRYEQLCAVLLRSPEAETAIRTLLAAKPSLMNENCYSGAHLTVTLGEPISNAAARAFVFAGYRARWTIRDIFLGMTGWRRSAQPQRKRRRLCDRSKK